MSFIRTMNGDISPDKLGFTYSHEHIVCVPPHWKERNEDDLLLDDIEKSRKDVQELKDAGCDTIIDATCVDYGRDVVSVKKIADAVGIQIVATTGFNKGILWDAKVPGTDITFAEFIDQQTIDQLKDTMVREVTTGVDNTGIRCGQIKFGTSYNIMTPLEIKTIRAACRAHLETHAPLHSHSENGTMPLKQMKILEEEGVDLQNISFGHMDRNPDPWMHLKIAEKGSFLCFDGIGKIKYAPECVRINCIMELVKHGYQKQILISGDFARKSYLANYGYGPGYKSIIEDWIPRFIEEAETAGFNGKELINDFFINNPRRCFAFKL